MMLTALFIIPGVASSAPKSAKDMEGLYLHHCKSYFTPDKSFNEICRVKAGDKENELLIPMVMTAINRRTNEISFIEKLNGYYSATLDPATGTITIMSQETQYISNHLKVMSGTRITVGSIDDNFNFIEKSDGKITATIDVDGTINFEENDYIMLDHPLRDYCEFLICDLQLRPVSEFVYDAEKWKAWGNCTITENIFAHLLGEEAVTTSTEMLQNIENENLFLVMDPYKNRIWNDINTSDGKGYLVVDISDPNCVTLLPLVPCGFSYSGMEFENDWASSKKYFINNRETNILYDKCEYSQLLERATLQLDKTSCIIDNTIYIYNVGFATPFRPFCYLFPNDVYSPISYDPCTIIIKPDKQLLSNIVPIERDTNEPVEYYNINGTATRHPNNGQIIIEKKDGKTVKRIYCNGDI